MDCSSPSREPTLDTLLAIIQDLLYSSTDGKLKRGGQKKTASKFDISHRTVQRYWKRYEEAKPDEGVLCAVRSRKNGLKGRRKRDAEDVKNVIRALLFRSRRNYKVAERYTKIPSTTLWRYVREEEELKPRKSHLQPILTNGNRVAADDYKVVGSGRRYGWDISMRGQPPNSPDFYVLDLGFFRALQSATQSNEDVIKRVKKEFDSMNPWTLNDVFLSLFRHMECAMAVDGGNFYKEPHLKKARRRKAGEEEVSVVYCDEDIYDSAVAMVEIGLDA